MKIKDIKINDTSLLNPDNKSNLESLLIATMQKAQTKAQEVVAEKSKDVL
jgi:DNA-binding protein YbaB